MVRWSRKVKRLRQASKPLVIGAWVKGKVMFRVESWSGIEDPDVVRIPSWESCVGCGIAGPWQPLSVALLSIRPLFDSSTAASRPVARDTERRRLRVQPLALAQSDDSLSLDDFVPYDNGPRNPKPTFAAMPRQRRSCDPSILLGGSGGSVRGERSSWGFWAAEAVRPRPRSSGSPETTDRTCVV
jgi:hypothetical protein